MKKIENIEEYLKIIKHIKKQCRCPVTNMFWSLEAVERYIKLERLFFEERGKKGYFICDEENYYRIFYYIDANDRLDIESLSKPIAIRNIYKLNGKKNGLQEFEKELVKSGFEKLYSAVEMYVPLELGEKLKKQKAVYERVLKKGNFNVSFLKQKDLDDMLELRKETAEFHVYNFMYKSYEEFIEEIVNQQYIGIFNSKEELCACMYIAQGTNSRIGDFMCVKEKYKMKYGLGGALMSYVLDNAINEFRQKYVSWCEQENFEAMKFHENIGFVNTGKASDEWVLE